MENFNKQKLYEYVVKNTPNMDVSIEEINDEMDLITDLSYDSLSYVMLIIDIEKEIEITLDDLDYLECTQIIKLYNYIVGVIQNNISV